MQIINNYVDKYINLFIYINLIIIILIGILNIYCCQLLIWLPSSCKILWMKTYFMFENRNI